MSCKEDNIEKRKEDNIEKRKEENNVVRLVAGELCERSNNLRAERAESCTKSSEANKDEMIVVTMRCIDMAASCSDIDKIKCSVCGETTWLSSSWRGKKIDRAICEPCFAKEKYVHRDYTACVTKSCLNDALKQLKNSCNIKGTDKDIKKRMMEHMEKKMGTKIIITD
jgi:hypothetical protein